MKRVAIYGWAATAVALVFVAGLGAVWLMQPKLRALTQDDIDSAVIHTLETKSLPSRPTRAAEAVRASVVEIVGYHDDGEKDDAARANGDGKNPGSDPQKQATPGDSQRQATPGDPKPSIPEAQKSTPPEAQKSVPPEAQKPTPPEARKQAPRDPLAGNDKPDGNRPEANKPDAGRADGNKPDINKPDANKPDGQKPDGGKPDNNMAGKDRMDGGKPEGKRDAVSIGSGVVVTDRGVILTNYHVIAGARRLKIRFYDGHESDATVMGVQPERDLAVIRATSLPDDLPAATLGSSRNLSPGDEVVAVGFPFGIGPSVSSGVVSGLNREFVSPESKQDLDGLIQFDAAANPGNSGGPLVNMDGEVVGIVTAILNPNKSNTFVGIGFATTIESAGSAVGISPF